MRARLVGPLLAVVGLVLAGACSTATPGPLARRTVAPPATADPAHPCTREAAAGQGTPATAAGPVVAVFDRPTNTIRLTQGQNVTLTALRAAAGATDALRETDPGEWLLGANLEIDKGATLTIAVPEVRWLKLTSTAAMITTVKAVSGGIVIKGSCVTSWDPSTMTAANNPDTTVPRSFVIADEDGATLAVDHAEIGYLGYGNSESYGLLWRTGSTGHIVDSLVSHNYFGVYTYQVGGLAITGNDVHDNAVYGIDPHTGSHDLTIENNVVHDNGKHGIILAEQCVHSVIAGNVVYRNGHHGIVLFDGSNNNTVKDNDTFQNASQGVNINGSTGNTVTDNRVYDNEESGIAVTDNGRNNTVSQNEVRGNKVDGIRLVTAVSATDLRDNVIGQNGRYGVYVESSGPFTLAGNTIFANRTGVLTKGMPTPSTSGNSIFDNQEAEVRSD